MNNSNSRRRPPDYDSDLEEEDEGSYGKDNVLDRWSHVLVSGDPATSYATTGTSRGGRVGLPSTGNRILDAGGYGSHDSRPSQSYTMGRPPATATPWLNPGMSTLPSLLQSFVCLIHR